MKPKYCKDCVFCKIDLQPHPQSGRVMRMYLCENINCSDPVDASPIPCGPARREVTLCGMHGKYHQPKPDQVIPNKDNVIQLASSHGQNIS